MQPKYTHSKSNIIKITESAKRRSRQRLIGSIILLFFALLILLNVTAKVKPIPINPEVIEINNASHSNSESFISAKKTTASMISHNLPPAISASAPPAVTAVIAASAPAAMPAASSPSGFKAQVVSQNTHQDSSRPHQDSSKPHKKVKLKLVNPADILNGTDNPAPAAQQSSYLQFAALSSIDQANKFQQTLASHGINAHIQPVQTAHGTLYRLKAGPFDSATAQHKLQQLADAGYKGIITGK